MNITLEPKPLSDALRLASKVTGKITTLPVLGHYLVAAVGDKVILTATNLDCYLTAMVPGTVEQEGICLLPLSRLAKIVNGAKQKQLTVESIKVTKGKNDYVATITNGATHTVTAMDPQEFPPLPKLSKDTKSFTLTAGDLRKAISRVSWAMSTDQARYVLNSVLLELSPGMLRSIATDGRRLPFQDVGCDWAEETDKQKGKPQIILPRGTVDILTLALANGREGVPNETPVEVIFDGLNYVEFSFQRGPCALSILSKQIDGNYPNYNQVLIQPDSIKTGLVFDRVALADALEIMANATTEKAESCYLETKGKEPVSLRAGPPDATASTTLAAEHTGKDIKIAFSPGFLLDAVKALEPSEQVIITFVDELSPLTVSSQDEAFLYTLMPMRPS